MADAVVAQARGVIAKYENRRRTRPTDLGSADPDPQ